MGLFNSLRDLCFGSSDVASIVSSEPGRPRSRTGARTPRLAQNHAPRRCQIEELESRRLMAGDVPQVLLGSVYFEEATGDDSQPDIIEVSFVGGAPGTTLNRLTINGDKLQNGLSEGDVFFDTAAGGIGAFDFAGLSITSTVGFTVNSVTVVDGGSQIVFDLTGFDAGEKLVFSVDADEAQFIEGNNVEANSLVEGAEFQRSIMTGQFSAVGYVDLTLTGKFWDAFDDDFAAAQQATGLTLPLHNDAYSPTHDFTDRTAGAVAYAPQVPLASLSGWVYHDRSNDGVFNRNTEQGIGGVKLELIDANGNPTGITTTTSTSPGKIGFYEFRNLFPGTYGVREFQPTNYLDGKDTPGDHGGAADSEALGPKDRIFGAVLDFGDHAVEYNFGELLPGSIRGRVHADEHEDCNFDEPEILLEGVKIDLLDAQGNVIATTLTNALGEYEFTGLGPGIYSVREHQPTQYYDGGERIGSAGGNKHDTAGFSFFTGIQITSGLHAVQYDFCEKVGVMLSGNVYHDRDNDGNFDRDTEEGIGNVVLKLLDENGNDTGLRATTNSAGAYKFNNLAKGKYTVVEIHPAGWLDGKDTPGNVGGVADISPPGDRISQIMINWGHPGVEYNFGELLPGSIRGRVHADDGPDCNFDDPHHMLEGVKIDLLDAQGNVIATTFTNDLGEYAFTGLQPGVTYSVREHQPEEYFDGGERVGSLGGNKHDQGDVYSFLTDIYVGSDQHGVRYDFCEKPPASISGRVHADEHEDCNYEEPEILLAGVKIDLLDMQGNLIATTTTNALGEYKFEGLRAGTYKVFEHQPTGYYDGGERVGSHGGTRDFVDTIHSIKLDPGDDAVHYDFCEKVGVSLSGYVYHDRSNDGIYDRNVANPETPIAGVVLKLLDASGNDTGKRATTDGSGFYIFNDLKAGTYSVMEIHPAGWLDGIDTPGNRGGSALTSPPGDMISQIVLNWAHPGLEYNFGELLPGSISGRIHADDGPDCEFDDPHHMLEGVQVDLLDAQGNVLATTYTNALGEYSFSGLRPGTYGVREHQPIEYFDGGERVGSVGGNKYDEGNFSFFSGINIGSGVNGIQYDFCEKPAAELSGFVYIDGQPILSDDPLTAEEIAALRDGIRTSDDTPLAGVVLELRHGVSGDPILVDQALPGHYAGGAGTPIRVTTDANGHYRFTGLRAGNYAVVEVQPEGVIDNLDHPGTLGGFAVNPVGLGPIPLGGIPSPAQATLEQFRTQFGDNAIVRIALGFGQHSQENNFSEVLIEESPPPPPPPPPPPVPPPVFGPFAVPYIPPLPYAPFVFAPPPPTIFGGSSQVIGFTWHLSVVNAGQPRSIDSGEARFHLASAEIDAAAWENAQLTHGLWTFAAINGSEVTVLREEVFGTTDSLAVTGDFNGDGVTDIGVFIKGHWYLDLNGNGHWDESDLWAQLGSQDDLPVTGDWDADGKTDIGIYGPAWPRDPWAISREPGLPDTDNFPTLPEGKMKNMPPTLEDATSGGRTMKRTARGKSRADLIDHVFHYGVPTDAPVTGDWNGDGIRQIGVFHEGQWNLDLDGDGRFTNVDAVANFGQAGDKPISGDFDGDGVDEIGVFRDGQWLVDSNHNRELDAQDKVFELGGAGDQPVVGDWNDDGTDDPGVFKPGATTDRVARRAG